MVKNKIFVYNIKMRKLILILILITVIGTHIYENRQDRLLSKFIYHALKHQDVVFETNIPDVEYVCGFMSFYSFDRIKPSLQEIDAHYTPFIKAGFYKHKCGEGTSAIVAVKKDHSLFTTYLNAYDTEFLEPVNFIRENCMKTNYLRYKIKNKKLYITRKSPD